MNYLKRTIGIAHAVMGIAAVFIPAHVQAEEEGNSLADLHYRPAHAALLGRVDFSPDIFYRSESPAGDPSSIGTRIRLPATLGLTYGISDALDVGVSENYLFHSRNLTERANGTSTSGSSGGFSDPTLSANYRYWGGLTGTLFADVFVNYSPSFGDAESTAFPGAGNNLRGSSFYQVGTNLFSVSGEHEFSFGATVGLDGNGVSTGGTSTSVSDKDSFYTFDVHGEYRYHLSPNFFADALATFNLMHTIFASSPNQTPVRMTESRYPCYVVPRLEFGYLFSPTWLMTLGVSYTQYTSNAVPTATSTSSTATNVKEAALDLGLRFVL